MQFITNPFGDELLYEVNRNTFDLLGANALYERHFGDRLRQENTLYIVVGTDSGLLPAWIHGNQLARGSRCVFVEHPELVDLIQSRFVHSAVFNEKLALKSPADWTDLSREFRFQEYAYLDRLVVVHSLGALDAFLPEYHNIRFAVEREVERFNREVKLSMGNRVFIQRQIENVTDNLFPMARIKGGFESYTAVLLGGGPSLDDVLPWVKGNRDRLVVMAVSRIARQLLDENISPDIVVSIDPHRVSYEVSKEMLLFESDCLLVNAYHIFPGLLAQWPGPAVYRGNHYPWKSRREASNQANAGPTVAHAAMATAIDMGFRTIVLGGVDLCFSREGHTHASGSNERKLGPSLGRVGLQVETNSGNLADTDHAFLQGVSSMGQLAYLAVQAGLTVVNPAPEAARIPHVEHTPASKIHLVETPVPFQDALKERLPSNDRQEREKRLRLVKQELANVNGRLRTIENMCEQALTCNRRLFGRDKGRDPDFKFKKRMDKIERQLDSKFADLSPVIKDYAAPSFLGLSRPDRQLEWSDDELEHFGEAYYKAYRKSAKDLLRLVESAQRRTDSRIEELSSTQAIVDVFQQWQKDRSPGRHRLWRQWHPGYPQQLSADQLKLLDVAADSFDKLIHEKSNLHQRHVQQALGLGLKPIRSKLAVLLRTEGREELRRIAEQTAAMEGDEAADLTDLGNAYLAELNRESDIAVGYYSRILERAANRLPENDNAELLRNPRLEDALRRMSYITLHQGDHENALTALSILSQVSPVYESQYADLLRLTGNVKEAVDAYTDYLQKAPGDISAMLKLGKLYRDIGAIESARSACDHILERMPDNQAAQQMRSSLESAHTTS